MLMCICLLPFIAAFAAYAKGETPTSEYIAQEKILYHSLFDNHDREIRPVQDYNDTLGVSINIGVYHFDMDEVKQTITLGIWARQKWTSFELQWNPDDHFGITEISVPSAKVWKPDILPYQLVKHGMEILEDVPVLLRNNGMLHWFPPASLTFPCFLNMRYFPWDSHDCQLLLGSWTYTAEKLNITDYKTDFIRLVDEMDQNWIIVKSSDKREEGYYSNGKVFLTLVQKFTIMRNYGFLSWIFVTPAILLALLTPFMLIIPPNAQQKLTMGSCLLLTLTIMISVIISYIPTAHSRVPLLGVFMVINFMVLAISLAVSSVVANMVSGLRPDHFPPEIIRKVMLQGIGRLFCLSPAPTYTQFKDEQSTVSMSSISQQGTSSTGVDVGSTSADLKNPGGVFSSTCFSGQGKLQGASLEWLCIAMIIDRLLFLVFFVLFVVFSIVFTHG